MIRRGIAKVRASAIAEALVINDRDSSSDMQLTTTHIINCLTPEILSFFAGSQTSAVPYQREIY